MTRKYQIICEMACNYPQNDFWGLAALGGSFSKNPIEWGGRGTVTAGLCCLISSTRYAIDAQHMHSVVFLELSVCVAF